MKHLPFSLKYHRRCPLGGESVANYSRGGNRILTQYILMRDQTILVNCRVGPYLTPLALMPNQYLFQMEHGGCC